MSLDERKLRTERELFIRSFGWPQNDGTVSAVRQLAAAMRENLYPPGAILYERGAIPRDVFFIMSGGVKLTAPDQKPWIFDRLSVVGGLDALQDIPHTRTATTTEESRCLLMPVDRYFEILQDNYELMRGMMQNMLGSLELDGAKLSLSELFAHTVEDPASLLFGEVDRRLSLVERLLVLRQAPMFGRFRSQLLVRLAETMEERRLAPGEVLAPGGAPSDRLWLVASGALEISRLSRPEERHRADPGHAFAIFAALMNEEKDYRAAAIGPTRVLGLLKADVHDALEDMPDMARVALAFTARERNKARAIVVNRGG